MLNDVANVSGKDGFFARLVLGLLTAEESIKQQEILDNMIAKIEISKNSVLEAYKLQMKKKNLTMKDVPPDMLITPEVKEYNEYTTSFQVLLKSK